MTFDSRDVAAIADLEAETRAYRKKLLVWQPTIAGLAAAEAATKDLSKDDVDLPVAQIRDDIATCLEELENILTAIVEAEPALVVSGVKS